MYRMLQKDEEAPHAPRQSGSFKALQDFIDSDGEICLSFTLSHTAYVAVPTLAVPPSVPFSRSLCGQALVLLGPGP